MIIIIIIIMINNEGWCQWKALPTHLGTSALGDTTGKKTDYGIN
jgi:hypothetical protein